MELNPDLVRSVAQPIVLQLLRERPMYGYEIIKVVNERTKGAFEWKEGTLYPCLHRLESAGFIRSRWEDAPNGKQRKYYSLSRKGAALLKEKALEWAAFSQAVNLLLLAPAEG